VARIEESIVVALPREDVFEFASQPENMPLWNPVVRESRVVGDLEEGAQVVQRIDLLGRRFETIYEVTHYEPCARVEYTSTCGPVEVRGTMRFSPVSGGTRVRWTVVGDARGFLRVADGVLMGLGRQEMRSCLDNLRRVMEEEEPAEVKLSPISVRAGSLLLRGGARLFGVASAFVTQKS
jgi:uncharacterized membrane protein